MLCTYILLFLITGVLGVEHLPKNDQFDSSFNQFLSTSEHQGAAVGMMHHGKLVYAQGYGRTADDKKVTPETLFQPSSISKSLTAVAILKLAEEKKLSLTDKVFGKYGILNHLSPGVHTGLTRDSMISLLMTCFAMLQAGILTNLHCLIHFLMIFTCPKATEYQIL